MKKNIRWTNNEIFVNEFVKFVARTKIDKGITTFSNHLLLELQSTEEEQIPNVIIEEIRRTGKTKEAFFKAAKKSFKNLQERIEAIMVEDATVKKHRRSACGSSPPKSMSKNMAESTSQEQPKKDEQIIITKPIALGFTQLPSERPNIPPMASTSSALVVPSTSSALVGTSSTALQSRWDQFSEYYQQQYTGPAGDAPDVAAAGQNAEQQQMNPPAANNSNFHNQAALYSQPPAFQLTWQMQKIRRRAIYEEQLNTWEQTVTAYENSQEKLARDAKHKLLFEKTFNTLKKMRETKERNNRVERSRISLTPGGGNGIGTLLLSTSTQTQINDQNEADLEQVGLENQKAYQAAALVPPFFSNPPPRFVDNRDELLDNPLAETLKQLEISQTVWTDTEKAVFTEKIALYPKNFAAIAVFLPTKTVKECVHFYYMTKKGENYKQTFRRTRKKKTGRQGTYRPPIMPRFGDTNENGKGKGDRSKLTTRQRRAPAAKRQKQQKGTTTTSSAIPSRGKPAKMTSPKQPFPQQQEESSSNKLPPFSTIFQSPPEKKKKRIDEEAVSILAKAQKLEKLDSSMAKLTIGRAPAAQRQKQQMGTTSSAIPSHRKTSKNDFGFSSCHTTSQSVGTSTSSTTTAERTDIEKCAC